ncbi:TetR/AcrR family transcriptional regulator [Cupriavidus sp. YR651]|uniref:TetR/AcrR family transcriptional regulator n=1 Tax=Cupriavidus sp. YR651 TaxID=1855315 RepID=UPI00210137D1|nr:TetR/AcrR family transcriptional regulator [Cupriavidus sp. YR651]
MIKLQLALFALTIDRRIEMARPREFDEDTVLEAAMQRFWNNGYEATSMRDLADHTGTTTPSLYNAFGDKRAIYRLVLDRYVRLTLETCSAIFGSDDPPLRALERYFDANVEEVLADRLHKGCFVVNTALEVAPHDQDFRDVVTEVFAGMEKSVRDCVAAGQRDGSILTSQPPGDIARLALSTILGLRVLARTNPDRELLTGVVRPFFVLLRTP